MAVLNPQPLITSPVDDLIWAAGLVATNADAAYPITNAQSSSPVPPFKSTTNTTTITITPAGGSPGPTPVYLSLHGTNATSGTFDGHTITFPGQESDTQWLNPRLDLRLLSVGASPWDLVLTASSGVVKVGRICLVTAVYPLNVSYGWQTGKKRPGEITVTTRDGTVIKHSADIRTRWARGVVNLSSDEAVFRLLDAASVGSMRPFMLIPDEAVNDAWFVRNASSDFSVAVPNFDVRDIPVAFDELSMGPPNG